jgi:hypothetical protein
LSNGSWFVSQNALAGAASSSSREQAASSITAAAPGATRARAMAGEERKARMMMMRGLVLELFRRRLASRESGFGARVAHKVVTMLTNLKGERLWRRAYA